MTRRPGRKGTAEGDGGDDWRAVQAADRYRERFGESPPFWEFQGRPRELERELLAAIERGEKVTAAQLYERFGITPPPPGVLI
jgi:hypothetical protein